MKSFLLCLLLLVSVSASATEIQYGRDVRPILAKKCFHCHGADESTREAKLRLDLREAASEVLAPGNPDDSELLARVMAHDADDQMPPPETGKTISSAEQDLLRRWITEGANYDEHWAFRPLTGATTPALDETGRAWAKNEIDAFIWARLQEKDLTPSGEASREVLIRRLYYDLTGLPPSPDEVAQFVSDPSPRAYENLVERLLASPHYGERWGRHWLDLAQYADTHGFERDLARPNAWRYRDYVIDSLNADKPWGQFVREQLAGDLIADLDAKAASPDCRVATSFVAAGPWDLVGQGLEEDSLNLRMVQNLDRDNMVHNVTQGLLGVTAHCARCHDHKFDPISQRDYYGLQAVFAGVERGDVSLPSPTLSGLEKRLARLSSQIVAQNPPLKVLQEKLARLEDELQSVPDLATAFLPLSRRKQDTVAFTTRLTQSAPSWEVSFDFGQPTEIAAVYLFPQQVFGAKGQRPGRDFPVRFRLLAGNEEATTVLRDFTDGPPARNPKTEFLKIDVRPTRTQTFYLSVEGKPGQAFALSEMIFVDANGQPVRPQKVISNLNTVTAGRLVDGWLSTHPFAYPSPPSEVMLSGTDESRPARFTLDFGTSPWLDTVRIETAAAEGNVVVRALEDGEPLPELTGWENPWKGRPGRTFNARGLRPQTLTVEFAGTSIRDIIAIGRGEQWIGENTTVSDCENIDPDGVSRLFSRERPHGYPMRWAVDLFFHRSALLGEIAQLRKGWQADSLRLANLDQRKEYEALLEAEENASTKPAEMAYALRRLPRDREIALLNRGVESKPIDLVAPRAPGLMTHLPGTLDETEPRLAFAEWVTAPENSLFWRNIVNRVWMHHFGEGLTTTPDDLGLMGDFPSHPDLIEFLADRFRSDGSLKNLHRLILTSATWRQSSALNPEAEAIDAGNRLLARANRRRLDAEAIHDTYLVLAGKWNPDPGGPGFRRFEQTGTYQPSYHYDQYDPADPETHRRSIYRHVVRGTRDPMMESLDCADPNLNVAQRVETLTAPQALTLVNHPFPIEMTGDVAARIAEETANPDEQSRRLWLLAVGREPGEEELKITRKAIAGGGLNLATQLVLNSNAFMYLD